MTSQPMSPAPGVPQTATKAAVAAVLGFVGTFIFALWEAVSGRQTELDTMTRTNWVIIILGALVTAAAAAGLTWRIPNKPL